MKLPSLNIILQALLTTSKRFPVAILATIAGTIAAMILVHEQHYYLSNLIMTTALVLPAFLSLELFLESRMESRMESRSADGRFSIAFSGLYRWVANLIGLGAFTLYFFSLPREHGLYDLIFFGLVDIALHLLVAFVPFVSKDWHNQNNFWQFNKALFIRILTALLYSGVLYAGLLLALLAVENLFDIEVFGEVYMRLWVFMMGIFNTLFFLGGVPADMTRQYKDHHYPKGLKVFTQYVLLPLVAIYLVVLYAYMVKIGWEWDWPRGWVSNLVLGFSMAGILSFLLLHPLHGTEGNKWLDLFLKWFYLSLIPLIILLGLAVFRRIRDYGITENRYFLMVLTFWLAGITLYFLFNRKKNIKIIPVSLCLLSILCAFGPWGAIRVARSSQLARFDKVLRQNNMLKEGQVVPANKEEVTFEDQKQLSSILRFLQNRDQLGRLKPYFRQAPDSLFAEEKLWKGDQTTLLAERMGIEYIPDWQIKPHSRGNTVISLNAKIPEKLPISPYDYLISINYWGHIDSAAIRYGTLGISFKDKQSRLEIYEESELIGTIDLSGHLKQLTEKYDYEIYGHELPHDELSIESQNETHRFKLFMDHISVEKRDNQPTIYSMSGMLLIGEKNDFSK